MKKAVYLERDVVNRSRAPDFRVDKTPFALKDAKALEIGGRYGGLSLWLAKQGADVLYTDLNEIPSEKRIPAGKNLKGSLRFEILDAVNMDFYEEFDVVVFKSVIGGIGSNGHTEKQKKAIDNMYQALKPGGVLLLAENLSGSPLHRYLRHRFVRWGREWRYVTISEMLDYLKPFVQVKYSTAGFLGTFGRSETTRNIPGYVDRLTDWIVPRSFRYIIFGTAVK